MKTIILSINKINEYDNICAITLDYRKGISLNARNYNKETNIIYVDNLEDIVENETYYGIFICGEFDTEICGDLERIEIKTNVKEYGK